MRPYLILFPFLCLILGACSVNQLDELEALAYSSNEEDVNYTIAAFKKNSFEIVNDSTIFDRSKYRELVLQFNQDRGAAYHNLRVAILLIGPKDKAVPILTIRRFQDFVDARQYAADLMQFISGRTSEADFVLPITQGNYRTLIRNRDVYGYEKYYRLTAAAR